ncbi:isoleucyl-tRNA synthetase, cytoplasmic, putative [Entamoeba invadens IP1]|uniref:isoleucine--tRNA ligase n=1 Tax=Entamoeba invadens IP1 TaxID=370355 RepID=A0A0A1U8I9_ENTIV|nr:isoleucyl-tRNA synthetase, cytoplasmic, putative [Entamoeba invadens IP1]ELP91250.1 isoleucyl-tRNA synthetase, cytoplasmic, putative [Entamoeba invadens IP1]|eukprot:XP_004258021.1 isoleucyl-tRNA synthetase, cytoplasmic, putative [Entamoeba invadens IP1]
MNTMELPDHINFPKMEEEIMKYWDDIKVFDQCNELTKDRPKFTFYDGPPFATGLPHYGHLLAGTIKDTVCRYAIQTGHRVDRKFGWDTHGLPIEFEIDKILGIHTTDEVLKYGIPNYNRECRNIVMRYSEEWKKVVWRTGRWIDMDHAYKTMDISFMESVWWVFKQLYEKQLVYRGLKVMPFSTGCCTPLSNFEAGLSYKDVSDPTVTMTFPVVGEENTSFLGWTTTPWTLPSNLALCVNANYDYVKFYDEKTKHNYYMLECRMASLPDAKKAKRTIIAKMKGKDLVGKHYVPLFPYFKDLEGCFRVVSDDYVDNTSGTGIVHQAPGFGEDDYRVCLANGVISKGTKLVCPIDFSGNFTDEVTDYKGRYIKDCDKDIIDRLKKEGRVFDSRPMVHSYPFCWRSDTPLIYRAIPSWFVNVESFKDKLVENSKQTYWVPENIREGRFQNWLSNARDWAISRNRFWGTPIPIWTDDAFSEFVCVGSVQELEELTGQKITDLHREYVDDLVIEKNGKKLHRITEVFDCWFESGSMPYGQAHYPFENVEEFKNSFPCDFIAEGIDQTRGWFYSLLVLSTALFDKPPFKNLIVNGLVLASDGKKMSKRLKNYPDPVEMIDLYGADALRLSLINSPAVRAETVKFQEKTLKELISSIFLPWFNTMKYLQQSFKPGMKIMAIDKIEGINDMDKWILSSLMSLVKKVREEMKKFRLYTVVAPLVDLLVTLSNWYIKLNRKRFRGESGLTSCSVLYHCLKIMAVLMAPFTPFFSEFCYQKLQNYPLNYEEEKFASVHFCQIPEPTEKYHDAKLEETVEALKKIIELGRVARDKKTLPLKQPLRKLTIIHSSKEFLADLMKFKEYILVELNVEDVITTTEQGQYIALSFAPEKGVIGKKYRKDGKRYCDYFEKLGRDEVLKFMETGTIEYDGKTFTDEDLKVHRQFTGDTTIEEPMWEKDVLILLDIVRDKALIEKGICREVNNRVQKLRKDAGLKVQDNVVVLYSYDDKNHEAIDEAINEQKEFLKTYGVILKQKEDTDKPMFDQNVTLKCVTDSIHLWLVKLN